jgi:hypothetical protein
MNRESTSPTREINRRLMLSLHQDGLFDLLAGTIVITFGLIPLLDSTGLNPGLRQVIILLCYGLGILTVLMLKRKITVPRSGFVKLQKRTTSRLSLILLIVNVLIFLFFVANYLFEIPLSDLFGSYELSVPLGLIFLVMFSVTGGLLKAVRFSLYGLLVFTAFVLCENLFLKGHISHHGIPLAAFTSGGIIIVTGLIKLREFIVSYNAE